MSDGSVNPLVTFALFAYNQEAYIQEALNGALSQAYHPLEIILSDDCSSDRTFEMMQHAASAYRGPHTVRLNRNAKNLNIGGHVNAINRLARGQLIVVAAGDDISLPGRTGRVVDAWLATNKRAGLLHSSRRLITQSGEAIADLPCVCLDALDSVEAAELEDAYIVGATEAWDRDLFNLYGDLRDDLIHEDCALVFRTLLAGRSIEYIDEPLVLYRHGVGVSTRPSRSAPHLHAHKRMVILNRLRTVTEQKIDDLRVIPNQLLSSMLMQTAMRQDAAILFENGWPRRSEVRSLIREIGFTYSARLMMKRIINLWRDGRSNH